MKAGLHCGEYQAGEPMGIRHPLFPAVKAGLHCGNASGALSASQAWALFPAVKAGLHCGIYRQGVLQRLKGCSSRP